MFLLTWPSCQQLKAVGGECKQRTGTPPNLIVVILPEGGNDIYTAVKQYVLCRSSKCMWFWIFFTPSFGTSRLVRNISGLEFLLMNFRCRWALQHNAWRVQSASARNLNIMQMCASSEPRNKILGQFFFSHDYRINVKLGGINTIPDPQSVTVLTDPRNPTIVMGQEIFCFPLVYRLMYFNRCWCYPPSPWLRRTPFLHSARSKRGLGHG